MNDEPAPANFLTAAAMAEALGVHPDTVRTLALQGRIPGAFRVGRCWRFDLEAFREAGGARGPAPAVRTGRAYPPMDLRAFVDTVLASPEPRPRWR